VNGGELAAGIDGDRECYTLDGPSVTPRGSRTVAATRRDEETLQVEKRDGRLLPGVTRKRFKSRNATGAGRERYTTTGINRPRRDG